MVCGASLPTTIVSYSVPVNVLKIEYIFGSLLGNYLDIGIGQAIKVYK
jgi:hypothetical protein